MANKNQFLHNKKKKIKTSKKMHYFKPEKYREFFKNLKLHFFSIFQEVVRGLFPNWCLQCQKYTILHLVGHRFEMASHQGQIQY